MKLTECITTDPEICHGKPVIRALRYPVQVILELLSSAMTTEEILAVLAYAARLSQIKCIEPVLV